MGCGAAPSRSSAPWSSFFLWEAFCRVFNVRPILLPAPTLVLAELAEFPLWFAEQSVYTLRVTLVGFALATVLGILFAVVITEWKLLDRLLFPLFVALNSVPKVALAPLFIIWFGTGAEPKIAIAFLIAVFAIVIDAALGLRSVPPDTLDLARTLRGSRLKVLLRIKIFCAHAAHLRGHQGRDVAGAGRRDRRRVRLLAARARLRHPERAGHVRYAARVRGDHHPGGARRRAGRRRRRGRAACAALALQHDATPRIEPLHRLRGV